jgi:TolA-binding protein
MRTFIFFPPLLLLATIVLGSAPAGATPVGATARAVSGDVSYRTTGVEPYRPLTSGTRLSVGAGIKTGANGWARLELSDGSVLSLGNHTELELSSIKTGRKKREGLFTLNGGKLRASVAKLAGQQTDFRFRSPTAVAGVKGTEFLMLSQGEANVLFGIDGLVSVAGTGKNREQQPLAAGSMVQTTRGAAPAPATVVEREPALAEARELFARATGGVPPADWQGINRLPDLLARWNVNYGHYLVDRGDFEQALQVFQIAIDLTQVAEIRADAWLERGTVHGRHLNNPRAALAEYLLVLEEYPRLPQAETALFSAGQTLAELGLKDQAETRFRQYLQSYPDGRHRSNVELLLKQLESR